MKQKHWLVFTALILTVVLLAACQRPASKAPVVTPTATSEFPFPLPATDDAMKVVISGTQTAIAAAGGAAEVTTPTTAVVSTPVPATATPIAVPTATPGHPATYTLEKGEFPFCIARRFNVSAGDLLALNGLTVNSKPAVGAVLKVPQSGSWDAGDRSLKAHPADYTVAAGDTIYTIACAYGDADPNAIIAANALKSPYTLTAGQTLHIP